jgi:hypothetical protein
MGAANTDVLEILATEDQCPPQSVCNLAPLAGSAGLFTTRESLPTCLVVPGLVLLTDTSKPNFVIQPATAPAGGAICPGPPPGGPLNGSLVLGNPVFGPVGAPAQAFEAPATAPPPVQAAVYLYAARVVRYRVAPDPNDNAPSLWRSATGRFLVDAGGATPTADPNGAAPAANWQLVARGIEDMQVQYLDGTPAWTDAPPAVNVGQVMSVPKILTSVTRQVRVTLSARSLAPVLQGATNAGNAAAPQALRGQLVSEITPRAAAVALQLGGAIE